MTLDPLGTFLIRCFDLNHIDLTSLDPNQSYARVYSAGGLSIGSGGGSDYGGIFDVNSKYVIVDQTGLVFIDLYLYINISNARKDHEFKSGEETQYCPHYYNNDDSMGKNNVYEAIEAHERAHANVFFTKVLSDMSALLLDYSLDDGSRSAAEILTIVESEFNRAWGFNLSRSNSDANQAVYNYFRNNQRWESLSDLGDWRRWRVRE